MTCTKCPNEITSKITGELCTSCYFKAKKGLSNNVLDDKPIETADSNAGTIIGDEKSDNSITERNASESSGTESNTEEQNNPDEIIKHQPSKRNGTVEIPNDGKKYCQSCIERGYGLVLASHEWAPGYFICDDCYQPLMNNIVQVDRAEVTRIKTEIKCDSPILNQVYQLLDIPEQLRFNNSEEVINSRNEIFNHHAKAIVNMNLDEVKNRIEFLQTILFNIRYSVDPYQDYINKEKAKAREQSGLAGLEKSRKEVTKTSSKTKLSDEEKMAKSLGMTVEKYREAVKMAKEKTFNKVIGK